MRHSAGLRDTSLPHTCGCDAVSRASVRDGCHENGRKNVSLENHQHSPKATLHCVIICAHSAFHGYFSCCAGLLCPALRVSPASQCAPCLSLLYFLCRASPCPILQQCLPSAKVAKYCCVLVTRQGVGLIIGFIEQL
jgi:hypothetical protein